MFPNDADVFDIARPVIEEFEDFKSTPYLCPTGHWTIAWGTTRYPNGVLVTPKDYPNGIPRDFAGVCLVSFMSRCRAQLEACMPDTMPTLHQAAALISLAYNCGVGIHDGKKGDIADSTLLEKLIAGDIESAADHFLDWDKGHVDGKLVEINGLLRRRKAERVIFLTAD